MTTASLSLEETTKTGLKQGTTYYVWVKDQAGNTNKNTVANTEFATGTVPSSGGTGSEDNDGNITYGTITFSKVVWDGNGSASTTISTSDTSYYIQYQVVSSTGKYDDEAWKTGDGLGVSVPLENLSNGDTVYARLWDGTNGGEYASLNIIDLTAPTVSVEVTDKTTSSFVIKVTVTDEETGVSDDPNIQITVKDSEGTEIDLTTSGISIVDNGNGIYTIKGLEDGTTYQITVTAEDNNGNTGEKTIEDMTASVPAASASNITFDPSTQSWTNGTVTVTATTTTDYYVETSTDTQTWHGGTASSNSETLSANGLVYARLTDGTNSGNYISYTVSNIDTTNPEATVTAYSTQSISFTGTDTISRN